MCVSQHHLGLVEGLDEQWARKRKKKYCNRCNLGGVFPIIKSLKLRISLQYSAFSQTSPDSKNRLRSLRKCQFSLLLLSHLLFFLVVLILHFFLEGFWHIVRTTILVQCPRRCILELFRTRANFSSCKFSSCAISCTFADRQKCVVHTC